MKRFIQGFALCYFVTALMFGAGMYRAMPALNLAGATYYGLVWPAWPLSVVFNKSLMPIPSWSFTFE